MRIAAFTPYLPYPPDEGGKIRSYHLLQALAAHSDMDLYTVYYGKRPSQAAIEAVREHYHRVVLFHLEKPRRTRDRIRRILASLPRSVEHFHTAHSLQQARRHLENGQYDLVIADEIHMTPYAELALDTARIVSRQKVDHVHFREMAKARPWGLEKVLDHIEAAQLQQYERAKMPFYQACVVCSQHDATLVRRDAPGIPVVVIPNGADLTAFIPSGRPRARVPTLLYVGSMHYYPNIDAVRFFFEETYGLIQQDAPGVRVQIVGHGPTPETQQLGHLPHVEVTGTVPDVRPYYEQASVFIVPLRLGGGTRLKIVEAMAMGLPVVSTTVGAEGLDVHPGEDILIADDAATFARSVLKLLSNPDLRDSIAKGGRLLARRYDWQELAKPYIDLVETVVREWKQ